MAVARLHLPTHDFVSRQVQKTQNHKHHGESKKNDEEGPEKIRQRKEEVSRPRL
jgi:S-adenosylmethionine:tRNA-ribosyltransferase-isomerase (queuine synthetase)